MFENYGFLGTVIRQKYYHGFEQFIHMQALTIKGLQWNSGAKLRVKKDMYHFSSQKVQY